MAVTLWASGYLSASVQVCTNPQSYSVGVFTGELAITLQFDAVYLTSEELGVEGVEISAGAYGTIKMEVEYDPCEGTITLGRVSGEWGIYARAIFGWGRFTYFKELYVELGEWPIAEGVVFDAPKIPSLCGKVDCCPEHGNGNDRARPEVAEGVGCVTAS